MTADWLTPGEVAIETGAGVCTLRMQGRLHRDLNPTSRDKMAAEVRKVAGSTLLLVDLLNVVRLDSWGEEKIEDEIEAIVNSGGRVAIVIDQKRKYVVRGLLQLLGSLGAAVHIDGDEASARAWLSKAPE